MASTSLTPRQPGRQVRVCPVCGASFRTWRSEIRKGWGRYCSRACKSRGLSRPLTERFREKVERRGPDDCWPWAGNALPAGYGCIGFRGRQCLAHRVAWEQANGPIPDGLCVLHRCDNPPCCNPAHLFLGTIADNNAGKHAKGRQAKPRGEKHSQAKLTDALVRSIRARYAQGGVTQQQLADEIGVGPSCISSAISGARWGHVT